MAKKKTSTGKVPMKTAAKTRQLKAGSYKSFKLSKKIKPTAKALPSAPQMMRGALGVLRNEWKLFGGIALIYGLLSIVLVRGIGSGYGLDELKTTFDELVGETDRVTTGLALFSYLVGSVGTTQGEGASIYQAVLFVIVSLAIIWTLRQLAAGSRVSVKDAYYRSQYPLVPFILTIGVILLQLIPALIGSITYGTVVSNGLAVSAAEKGVWVVLFGSLTLLSIYMVCSSIFALYIVTLPDMTPLKALRSARQLVLHRRWSVARKLFLLPALLVVAGLLIVVPLIFVSPLFAEWMFYLGTLLTLLVSHSYVYTMYRELIA